MGGDEPHVGDVSKAYDILFGEPKIVDPGVLRGYGVGIWPLTWWDWGFEFRRGHGYLSTVNVVCCAGRGLCNGPIPRPEESYRVCVYVSLSVTRRNSNDLHLQWVGRRGQTKKRNREWRHRDGCILCIARAMSNIQIRFISTYSTFMPSIRYFNMFRLTYVLVLPNHLNNL